MAALLFSLLVLSSQLSGSYAKAKPVPAVKATYMAGGASAISALVTGAGGLDSVCGVSKYQSVGSGEGIDAFNAGTYVVGVSDQPMDLIQDKTGISGNKAFKKCTIPIVLARFGFFVRTGNGLDGTVKLNADSSYRVYKNGGTWSQYGVTVPSITGLNIQRFYRNEPSGSGTTLLIKRYWAQGGSSFLADYPSALNFLPFPFASAGGTFTGVAGTGKMCSGVSAVLGAIGYAQVGLCDVINGLTEVALMNKAGSYIVPSQADPTAAAPRNPPKNCGASWSRVANTMVFQKGARTAPIVTFAYTFIRQKGLKKAGALGPLSKKMLTCWVKKAGSIANNFGFTPAAAATVKKALAGLKSVKL